MNEGGLLEIVVDQLFDHSGIFPPAAKPLEDAVRDASLFPSTLKRPWLSGSDMVVDLDRANALLDLNLLKLGFGASLPIRVSLLASAAIEDSRKLLQRLSLPRKDGVSLVVQSFEVKIGDPASDFGWFSEIPSEVSIAVEPNLSSEDWEIILGNIVNRLADCARPTALKCRCTGPTGIGAHRLAHAVAAAADAAIPFKVTGGLHHPIVEERFGNTLGFLNLAVAVLLRRVLGDAFSTAAIEKLLTNTDASRFDFERELRFHRFAAKRSAVIRAKEALSFSVGSCSLFEPDEDLVRLFGMPGDVARIDSRES